VNVIRGVGGEEDRGALEVLGLAEASSREADKQGLGPLGVFTQRARQLGGEVARGDGVDVDPQRRPLVGEGAGKVGYAGLGRRVGGYDYAAFGGEDRGGVDDLALLVFWER
jgi:hypothetical protein